MCIFSCCAAPLIVAQHFRQSVICIHMYVCMCVCVYEWSYEYNFYVPIYMGHHCCSTALPQSPHIHTNCMYFLFSQINRIWLHFKRPLMAYRIVAATITVTVTVTAKAAAVAIFVAPLFVIVTLVACMRCTEHSSEHDLECLRIAIHTHTHRRANTQTYIHLHSYA